MGVNGNKLADKAAKEAALGQQLDNEKLPVNLQARIPTNPTAAKRTWRHGMEKKWVERLEGSDRTRRMKQLDDRYPSLDFSAKATKLPRQHFAALVQLRLGHFPTAGYLYRFGARESPRCTHCEDRAEIVQHYLMKCVAFTRQRSRRDIIMGAASRNVKTLLTPGKSTRHLMEYIYDTGKMKRGRDQDTQHGED